MIVQYYRPETVEEALRLLEQRDPPVYPLGGGSVLSQPSDKRYAVVDLLRLGLDGIVQDGNALQIGATTRLQALADGELLPSGMRAAARRETSFNLRQTVTLAGTIVSARGNSPLVTALLAADARLRWQPGDLESGLGEYLALRHDWQAGRLITALRFATGARVGYADVAKTPADVPVVCAAVAVWPGGRTRVALGGPGASPVLAMDGLDAQGAEEAAFSAYSHLGHGAENDGAYLSETSRVLVRRLLADLTY